MAAEAHRHTVQCRTNPRDCALPPPPPRMKMRPLRTATAVAVAVAAAAASAAAAAAAYAAAPTRAGGGRGARSAIRRTQTGRRRAPRRPRSAACRRQTRRCHCGDALCRRPGRPNLHRRDPRRRRQSTRGDSSCVTTTTTSGGDGRLKTRNASGYRAVRMTMMMTT